MTVYYRWSKYVTNWVENYTIDYNRFMFNGNYMGAQSFSGNLAPPGTKLSSGVQKNSNGTYTNTGTDYSNVYLQNLPKGVPLYYVNTQNLIVAMIVSNASSSEFVFINFYACYPNKVYSAGALVDNSIIAKSDAYLNNTTNTDGYWYIRGSVYNNTPPISSITATGEMKVGNVITLTAGKVTDADGDTVQYRFAVSLNGGAWSIITTSTSNTATYTIPSGTTTVKFSVVTYDGKHYADSSPETQTYTVISNTAPTVPPSITVTGNIKPGGAITVTCEASTDADGDTIQYHMQYSYDNANWTDISTATTTSRTFTVPANATSEKIYFRVRAYDGKAYSGYRTSAGLTIVYNTAPTAPTFKDVTSLRIGSSATVNFNKSTDVDGDSLTYELEYRNGASGTWTSIIATVGTSVVSGSFTVPVPSTELYFRARAYDGKAYSAWTTSPSQAVTNNRIPSAPASITASGDFKPNGVISVVSAPSTDADEDEVVYLVQYSYDKETWTDIAGIATTRSFTIPANVASKTIYFRVRAFDGKEYSQYTTSVAYTIAINTAPTAPTAVYIQGNPVYMNKRDIYTLVMEGATDAEGDNLRYYVSISTNEGLTWTLISAVTTPTFRYVVAPEITPNLMFRVRTFDGKLYSDFTESDVYIINSKAEVTFDSPAEGTEINDGDVFTISGTVIDTDPYQEVEIFFTVGDNPTEHSIGATISGAIFNYSKTLTFKNNALYAGENAEELIASNIVSNEGNVGNVRITVFAKDNLGTYSVPVSKSLTFKVNNNQKPEIAVDTTAITLVNGVSKTVNVTAFDPNEEELKFKVQLQGSPNSLTESLGLSDGVNNLLGTFTLSLVDKVIHITGIDGFSKPLSNGEVGAGIYLVEVVAEDAFGNLSDVKTIAVTVEANDKPVLDVSVPPSIVMINSGLIFLFGSVTDANVGDTLTLTVSENGGLEVPIELDPSGNFFFEYDTDFTTAGVKTLVFTASDGKETVSVTREFEVIGE